MSESTDIKDLCSKKNASESCQCDDGYQIKRISKDSISCVATDQQTFSVMLHPRVSFYLSQSGSIVAVSNTSELYRSFIRSPSDVDSPSILRITWSMRPLFRWTVVGVYSTQNNAMDTDLSGNRDSIGPTTLLNTCRIMQNRFGHRRCSTLLRWASIGSTGSSMFSTLILQHRHQTASKSCMQSPLITLNWPLLIDWPFPR